MTTTKEEKRITITTTTTSKNTAKTDPIILNETDIISLKFEPDIINNSKDIKKSVSGKLVYEKKRKNDINFPSLSVTRGSLKTGEYMNISLDTSETYNLFEGLKERYELHKDFKCNIPHGSNTFIKVDKYLEPLIKQLKENSNFIGDTNNLEVIKLFLEALTKENSQKNLIDGLKGLQNDNVDIEKIKTAIDITRLLNIRQHIEDNLLNSNEEFWQKFFADNQWIISQISTSPMTIFVNKGYVGGKDISNCGGNLCDFIFKNSLSDNISLIEIKTPTTNIIGSKYRQVYSLSADLSGSINQILSYKDSIIKDYYSITSKSGQNFKVLSPKCFIIIGTINKLDSNQKDTFEDFRNSLNNINIITFDELLMKIDFLISLLTEKIKVEVSIENEDVMEDDCPF